MLRQRIVTALVLAPLALLGVFYLPPEGFAWFVGAVVAIGAWEWAGFAGLAPAGRLAYAAGVALLLPVARLAPAQLVLTLGVLWWCFALYLILRFPAGAAYRQRPWQVCGHGVLALVPAWLSLLVLKADPEGNLLILTVFLLIWGADIGAYFTGRALGAHKLAERVSPGKTWEGVAGGLVAALCLLLLVEYQRGRFAPGQAGWWLYLGACLVVVMASIVGDLTESLFKRQAGVKDSSRLLPGHGGVLDRIDSLLAAGPVYALLLALTGT